MSLAGNGVSKRMNRRFVALTTLTPLIFVGLSLGACSTLDKLNPFSSSTPSKHAPAVLTPVENTADIRVNWQLNVGTAGNYVFTPAVVGDSVYAAGFDGNIARIDKGQSVWKIAAGQKLSAGVGADYKLVAVGTPKGDVLTFEAESGKPAWQARVSSEVLAAPEVAEGLVLVRSGDSKITALDARDGKRRWVYQRTTPPLNLRSHVGMLVTDKAVIAGYPGGKLVAIDLQNGAPLWEATVALPRGSTELERMADITSTPVRDGREICSVAYQGRLACFDVVGGNLVWGRDLSSGAGLDLDLRRAYVSDDNGTVHAFSRESGASVWKQDKLTNRNLSRPIVVQQRLMVADFRDSSGKKTPGLDSKLSGSYIAVGDLQGIVHLLNSDDGEFAARVQTDGSPIVAEPQALKEGFVVQTKNGGVFALGGR